MLNVSFLFYFFETVEIKHNSIKKKIDKSVSQSKRAAEYLSFSLHVTFGINGTDETGLVEIWYTFG